MITKYKITNLGAKTTKDQQTKLVSALKGVSGVDNATLHLGSSEVEIKPLAKQEPIRADLSAAVTKAGFSMAAKA